MEGVTSSILVPPTNSSNGNGATFRFAPLFFCGTDQFDAIRYRDSPANNSVRPTLGVPRNARVAMESVMKAKLARYSLCVCVMLASGSVFAQNICPNSVFNGSYVFKDSGTILDVGAYGSAGTLAANGSGAGNIYETSSTAGVIQRKTTAFTYRAAAVGTGDCEFSVSTADGRSFDLYLKANGKDGTFISTGALQAIMGDIRQE
jgi:hypothetical protein